ncbi:MAG: hypothetical protein GXO24_00075 [Chlorobi bacterium]|nr:hypothetical protein [Chlorobiota bacterium]
MSKIKTLVYFDNDKGRDVEILMPVLYYGEKYLNLEIEKAFIFDIDKIRRHKPDLVILANTIGSRNHHLIAKYAHQNGIKVFALISEGNFRTDGTFNYWGYNTDRKFYQEYICHWSERTRKFLVRELPEYADRMVVTGATGFDRYKIYDFETKESFLKRYGLEGFRKVIGYAGWAFGKLHNPNGLEELHETYKEHAPDFIRWMHRQQIEVENLLRTAIENNPDTLFILKRHPNEKHPHLTQPDNNEMVRLADYPNVLYLTDEEDVHTLISVSDIWTAFESTTVLEAWLMKPDMPTIFLNPDPDFKRDINYKGTVVVSEAEDFQNLIDEFYRKGKVEAMYTPERVEARHRIVRDVIGFADGMNHIRAGYYLAETVKKIRPGKTRKVKPRLLYVARWLGLSLGQYFYYKPLFLRLPKFKKTVWIFDRHKLPGIERLKKRYYPYLDRFHAEHDIPEKITRSSWWKSLWESART